MKKHFSKPDLSRKINGDLEDARIDKEEKIEDGKIRVDEFLAEQNPDYSKTALRKLVRMGGLEVNGEVETEVTRLILPEEDKIQLTFPEKQPVPELDELRIFENENVIVVNKPAGLLSVKNGTLGVEPTLEDYGLVAHRLDKLTSGVVILAKNQATKSFLQKQFQQRKVHKVYFAAVEGQPKMSEAEIDIPLKRNLARPTTFKVDRTGRTAETYYRVVATSGKYSLLELHPKTGRTHQLRVHLSYIGCPIVGDPIYGSSDEPKTRMMLHARELEITVPTGADLGEEEEITGCLVKAKNERMTFRAEVPVEFLKFMKKEGLEYEF